jgi:hypothetical protein
MRVRPGNIRNRGTVDVNAQCFQLCGDDPEPQIHRPTGLSPGTLALFKWWQKISP